MARRKKKTEEDQELSLMERIKRDIEDNVKGTHVSVMADSEIASTSDWIKTPALDFNRILSGCLDKGLPTRNLIGIVGPEHTFKSSFMTLCMAEGQRHGFTPIIIDTERGITNDFCIRWGLDPKNVLYNYTPYTHEVKAILAQIRASEGEKFIIGLDSAGGLDRLKSYEDALKGDVKADQGALQKEIKSLLKLFLNVCVMKNSIGIVCGHMYGSPGTGLFPQPDKIGGGKSMTLLPSIIINLKKKQKKEGKVIVGTEITATAVKNRYYPPFNEAIISIDYQKGIDEFAGLYEILDKMGIIEKSGSWYSIGDDKVQGKDNLSELIKKDKDKYIKMINKWLEKTGYSTVNENLKEAAELSEKEDEKPKKTTKKTTSKVKKDEENKV